MSFQTRKRFVRLRNTIWDILDENQEACECPIDCQINDTVKAHKSIKNIYNRMKHDIKHHCLFSFLFKH